MKNVLLLTHFNFWRKDGGQKVRIAALADYLGKKTQLTVVYAGKEEPMDTYILEDNELPFDIVFLEKDRKLSPDESVRLLLDYIAVHPVDVCIIEYIQLAFIASYLPDHITLILDTHDLMSDRNESFKNFGYHHEDFSFQDELNIFRKFDAVMLIQQQEYEKVYQHIFKKAILAPHPVSFPQRPIKKEVTNIGFIGNSYPPNEDGIKWFVREVWSQMDTSCIELNIYGHVCRSFTYEDYEQVTLHGFVPNLDTIFNEVDILINPVRFGAGLKIKNVEAMGNGIPLVTTTHSARGLMEMAGEGFLTADDGGTFKDQLNRLINDFQTRVRLGKEAYHYIQQQFSPSQCFGQVLQVINQ